MSERDIFEFLTVCTETPELVCVECGKQLDRTTGPVQPGPNDCVLCVLCGSLNVFDDNMRFRRPTDDEMLQVAADSDFQELRRLILLQAQMEMIELRKMIELKKNKP